MTLIAVADGNTPLSPEELADLLPNLSTKAELNEWERENILLALDWAGNSRVGVAEIVSEPFIRKLHEKMLGDTWKWAGKYRHTDKNIGVPFYEIEERLGVLLGDVRYWIEHTTYSPDEIAVRFHHQLALIHPFPNGNGRHSRLMADLLVSKLGNPPFTWGSKDLVAQGEARTKYLGCLHTADQHDVRPLLEFSRS